MLPSISESSSQEKHNIIDAGAVLLIKKKEAARRPSKVR